MKQITDKDRNAELARHEKEAIEKWNASGEKKQEDDLERIRKDYERLKIRYRRTVALYGVLTGALVMLVGVVFISAGMGLLNGNYSSVETEDNREEIKPSPTPNLTGKPDNVEAQFSGPSSLVGEILTEERGEVSLEGQNSLEDTPVLKQPEKVGDVDEGEGRNEEEATEGTLDQSIGSEEASAWFPADHASEQAGSILIEPMEIQMMPAGTVYELIQVDWESVRNYFQCEEIVEGDAVYNRIIGKSLPEDADIPLSDLRYLKMLHVNYEGQAQVGEMIVNAAIAEDVLDVFCTLFENCYPIKRMVLIDDYWTGDPLTTDDAAAADNNTSCFCYRKSILGDALSVHASGRGIELNPLENPYVYYEDGEAVCRVEASRDFISNRWDGRPHVITTDDLAVRVFEKAGFIWGGDWNSPKVYQVFQKKA